MTFFWYQILLYSVLSVYQTLRVYGGLLQKHFLFTRLIFVFDHEQEGADFFSFSLKTGVSNEYQLIATNSVNSKIYLIELSQSYKKAVVLRIIIQEKICRPRDCTYLNDRYYCTDEDGLNVIKLKQDGSFQVTFLNTDRKVKFPFGVVAADNPLKDNRKRLVVSDLWSRAILWWKSMKMDWS